MRGGREPMSAVPIALSPSLRFLLRLAAVAGRRGCGSVRRTLVVAPATGASPHVEAHRLRNHDEFLALVNDPTFTPRWLLERHLARKHQHARAFCVPGICVPCGRAVDFAATFEDAWEAADGLLVPNWREHLCCPCCGLSGRQRRVTELVSDAVGARGARARVYLMETLSPLYRWVAARLPEAEVVGSEYLAEPAAGGARPTGIRHEDAEQLSFPDASLDVVVSCDVFEHVHDPRRAFAEAVRVLRPGGRAIFTFPMDPSLDRNRRRAEVVAGGVRHVLPPVRHGNPLSPEGALVFTDFGWEVLEDLRDAGLADPALELYWSYEHGYLGIQFCLVAGKA